MAAPMSVRGIAADYGVADLAQRTTRDVSFGAGSLQCVAGLRSCRPPAIWRMLPTAGSGAGLEMARTDRADHPGQSHLEVDRLRLGDAPDRVVPLASA